MIGCLCLLSRSKEHDRQAVRIEKRRPWRLPLEPEAERIDVETFGAGQITDPEREVTDGVGTELHGVPSLHEQF
jgi:hypothetical protein